VLDVRDSQRGEVEELLLHLKPGAEALGIRLADVSRQVRQAYFGEEVQRLPRANGDVKVMVRYPRSERRNLASLNDFRVRTDDGRELPLMSVVDVEISEGVQRIQRRDGERVIYVRADIEQDLISDIKRDIDDAYIEDLQGRYPGLAVLKGGAQEEEEQFISEITSLYAIALFAMYALIAVAFHSYWLPLLIMTAIPFGFMGAVFGHLIFNTPMALFSYFGIGAAAGVVVNDNLVLVDYIGRLRQRQERGGGDTRRRRQPLPADPADHRDHLRRTDSDHGGALHQRAVPQARGAVPVLRGAVRPVRDAAAGTRSLPGGQRHPCPVGHAATQLLARRPSGPRGGGDGAGIVRPYSTSRLPR
jgi:Cu/Ag efflux pump CusA